MCQFFLTKVLQSRSAQCRHDNVNNLQSTGAGCHDKTVSHFTGFVPHTFGQTRLCCWTIKKVCLILGFQLQLWKYILVIGYVIIACFGKFGKLFEILQIVSFIMCKLWELTVDITTDVYHNHNKNVYFFIFCFLSFVQFSSWTECYNAASICEDKCHVM